MGFGKESVSVFKSILKYPMTLSVLEPSQKQNSAPLKLCIIQWLFTSCSCVLLLCWYFMGFILGLCITHVNQNVFWSISKSQNLMFSFPPFPLDLLCFISSPVLLYNQYPGTHSEESTAFPICLLMSLLFLSQQGNIFVMTVFPLFSKKPALYKSAHFLLVCS